MLDTSFNLDSPAVHTHSVQTDRLARAPVFRWAPMLHLGALVAAYGTFLTQPLMTASSSARELLGLIHGMSPAIEMSEQDFIGTVGGLGAALFKIDIDAQQAVTYSVLSSLEVMFRQGSWLAATLILVFAILLPVAKLSITCAASLVGPGGRIGALHARLLTANRFQLLDVLVIAILVIAWSSIGVAVQPEIGFYALVIFVALFTAEAILRPRNPRSAH